MQNQHVVIAHVSFGRVFMRGRNRLRVLGFGFRILHLAFQEFGGLEAKV